MKKFNLQELQEQLKKLFEWVKTHRETVTSILIVAGVILVFGIYFIVHFISARKQAWEKVSFSQTYAMNGYNDQAIKLLDEVLSSYSGTKAAFYAKLYKADIFYRTNNFQEAIKLYQNLVQKCDNKTVQIFAYLGLGTSFESTGSYNEAIKTYSDFISKFPEHFLASRVYESLARTYRLAGLAQQSKETYEKLLTLYPGTYFAKKAQEYINPQQNTQQNLQMNVGQGAQQKPKEK